MAKKVAGFVKFHVTGGQATPAAPVGTALGPQGVNIMEFCKQFNARTQKHLGTTIPAEVTIYVDRSFTFITKTPPTAFLLKRAAGIEKASGVPHTEKVGTLSPSQVREIAEIKMPDLNTKNMESAMRMVAGTARSMGIEIEG